MLFSSYRKKIIKSFGYKDDQDGILNRFYREEGGWNQHLQNTRDFIIESSVSKNKKSVVIYGSGWLLDVPVKELSKIFGTVYLIDIVHPREVKHKVSKLKNVICIEADITAGVSDLFYNLYNENSEKNVDEICCEISQLKFLHQKDEIRIPEQIDFHVSVNLLNQLDILITDFVREHFSFSDDEILKIKKQIQQNHIELLPTGKSCLITDYEEQLLDNNNQIRETKPLIHIDLPASENKKYWQWDFDRSKTYYKNYQTIFNVVALDV